MHNKNTATIVLFVAVFLVTLLTVQKKVTLELALIMCYIVLLREKAIDRQFFSF